MKALIMKMETVTLIGKGW